MARRKDVSTVEYLRARERLDRDWGYFLSASEVRVLGWLMSMTLGWRNSEGNYSLTQMLRGVRNIDVPNPKEFWVRGVGLSHFTLRRVLKRLEGLGVVRSRRSDDGRKAYAINRDWQPEVRDGSCVTTLGQDVPESGSAQNQQSPCSESARAMPISSAERANAEHPYKTNNTRQNIQATHHCPSPSGLGDDASWIEKARRLEEDIEETREAHLINTPASELSEHQRAQVMSRLTEEDSWHFQELVHLQGMSERQAFLELSRRIAIRGEQAQFKEGKRVKAKRLYKLADLLRVTATG
jgi:hypothetical protein